ncbi:MAG: ABC transporter ATP-binding protein [Desulfobacterales bacterium]|nr:ABC transporter ATP-binding protein [Desulfobacterales bacterium]
MTELLRTEDLSKAFGHFIAVDSVTINFTMDTLTSIIGPNGAGKTTLINLLTGSLPMDSGRIFFKGEEITKIPTNERVKRGIGRSFQIMNIFPMLTVFQNVQIPVLSLLNKSLKFFSRLDAHREVINEVERISKEVGLWDKREVLAGELSHGDQRLLEMSIAIASQPELCFLDEPTSGMNPRERVKILENIRRLSKERRTTFIIVEHDMDVVFSLSDRIVVMHRGGIIADGKPDEIKENQNVKEVYLGEELEEEII